ncbi:hypothetical protein GGR50DRAFT_690508 [Xylaria sp. CBS 124048]|nr:hypothetical protein GGR50DRAFT_690508 [Xylaria sp. CBS 124048]
MRIPRALLSLPPSFLILLAAQLHGQAAARTEKNDGVPTLPTAVRKMSLDEGEKFMPDYYAFAPLNFDQTDPQAPLRLLGRRAAPFVLTPDEDALLAVNSSAALTFRPPYAVHSDSEASSSDSSSWSVYRRGKEVIARLRGRGFTCPGSTHDCSAIGEPDYCCTDGTVCFVVENAPDAGNVGCCPDGQTCGGSVASCADGDTACPAEDGGGCCIPGFVCADIGCVASTAMVSIPTTTTTATPQMTTEPPSTMPKQLPPTGSSSQTSSASGSSSGTGLPPVRATSSKVLTTSPSKTTPTTTSAPTSNSSTPEFCPTGFYACVASAGSGCCRTGRDCSTTSCPPIARTTIITHGATIAVPLTDAQAASGTAAPSATCASGWFQCGADAGPVAGCCPSGFVCGTASCTLSAATATATVQKELPLSGGVGHGTTMMVMMEKTVMVWMVLGWVVFFQVFV